MLYTQPQVGPLQVDWGNPLTRGLIFAFDGANPTVEAAARRVYAGDGSSGVSLGIGPFGRRLSGNAGTAGNYRYWTGLTTTVGYTALAVVLDSVGRGTTRNPFDSDDSNGGTRAFQLRFNTSNQAEFIPFNTGGTPFFPGASSASSSATGLSVIAATVDASKVARVYLNAVAGSTDTITGTPATLGASDRLAVGGVNNPTASGAPFKGDVYATFFWNRALSAAEIASISANPWQLFLDDDEEDEAFLLRSSGIQPDASSNSGYQAAQSSYTFTRTVTGANPFLGIDVALLSAGSTVTSIVDDYGGANVAMSLIGGQSTVTSFGRVEQWGLANPATGTKTIQVNLSGSISSVALASSYTGVHQSSPTEAFNSAQATNVGAADASVVVTTLTDGAWVHAAVATGDGSITANQTSRNNVSGVGGSGASEDNGGPQSPAGAVTMSFAGVGAAMTWAIGGYALRPVTASGTDTAVAPGVGTLAITGLAPTVAQSDNHAAAPGAGTLAITGLAPTVAQSDNHAAAPGTGTLTITGFAPTILQPQTAAPGMGTLTITGFAPSVTQAVNQAINPGVGTLALTGFAPAVTQTANQNTNPGAGVLVLSGFAPAVTQSANQFVAPGSGTMVITGFAPTVTQASASPNLTPAAGTVVLSGFAPSVAQAAAPRDPRFARPVTDVSAGSWLPSVPGATLASMIDEPSADSSDYDYTTVASTCEVALNAVTDPLTSANQVARYQVWSPEGNGLTVSLMQGATTIASWTHAALPAVPTIYAQALTGAQCDAITDYADLRYRFTAA